MSEAIACAICGRVIWATDADDKGRCCECRPARGKAKAEPTDEPKGEGD